LAEWEEYHRLEPVGSYKMDFHFAHLCDLLTGLAHAMGGSGKRRTTKIMDFMPWWFSQYGRATQDRPVERQSWQEMKARMTAIYQDQKRRKK
jgi:hypothetical protein